MLVSKRYAMRLLRLLPSLSLLSSSDCRSDHGMVTVTRLGFLVKMEGMLGFSFLYRKLLDNEVISSITVGLVTGQVAATTLAHLIIPGKFLTKISLAY